MMLSIIIPVYKTESTLDRCMESIVRQEYQDWEAILVDDGSPDGCPAICDEWGRRDPRISVVHQKNGGLSAAGKLVAEGTSIGGEFSWDCCMQNGRRVSSGIYYALCTDEAGKKDAVAKILIIR